MAATTAPRTDPRPATWQPAPKAVSPASAPTPRRPVREEIQALRALAVALVVVHHFWPSVLPGGFVGVDVFFAISGFLITGLLVEELERTGRLSLAAFWARRARRLLPAALLVLLACAAGTVLLVPLTEWDAFFDSLLAGTLYVENWHLAGQAVDYFAPDVPSPVQHFWTLSVEEQFYVAWPLLVLGAAMVSRSRRALAVALALLTVASLSYGILATDANSATAFFNTPARAWEFGLGGLVALAAAPLAAARRRGLLSWLGLAAIVAAAVLFSPDTPFPGIAALLPVAGALAVIAAGMPASRLAPSWLLARRPVQQLGDLSYSVYLWHWPLLVLTPYALDREVDWVLAFALLAMTLGLAGLSKLFVEDPVRVGRALVARRPRWTFAAAVVGMVVVCGAAYGAQAHLDQRRAIDRSAGRAVLGSPCFGAGSFLQAEECRDRVAGDVVVPSPLEAQQEGNAPCTMVERRSRLAVCAFGVAPGRARETVALVGDSHAAAWRAALAPVAERERWHALSITRTGCPFTTAARDVDEPARGNCLQWNREVQDWFAAHPEVTRVFVAARFGADVQSGRPEDGYAAAWQQLPPSVREVVVLRDTPRLRFTTQGCVQEAMDGGGTPGVDCAVARDIALGEDPQVRAAAAVPRTRVVDLSDVFCDAAACRPVIGGALVFRDEDHLTATFARTLGPLLRRQLR